MGTLYTSQSAAGYNSSPPPDDGSQGANNQITWGTTIKAKLADPIKALADAINSQLTTALDLSPRAISTPDSAVASDHWRTLQVTGTTTITLSDAATMTSKYVVGIANLGVGTVTVTRATGANTVNGTAADFTIPPKASVVLGVNQAANGYNVLSSTGIALTSLTTPTVFTPIIDSGTTGSLSLKTNNGTTIATFGGSSPDGSQFDFIAQSPGSTAILRLGGSDTNVTFDIRSKGTGAIGFSTDGTVTAPVQFQVLHTASATRNITVTGSNGGNPTISTTAGNLAVGTVLDLGSTGQLQFPATQNPSAGVNVLDDYEEGTWVPSVGGSATYLAHNGFYTKIGNTVFIRAQITVSAVGTGSTTVISGLPFTSDSTVPQVSSVISAEVNAGSATNIVSSYGVITAGGTSVTLQSRTAASAADSSNAIFGTNTAVTLSGTYHTAT